MRLFLAVDLPREVRDELGRLQAGLRTSCPGWRWARPEGIHATLRFLGEVDPADEPGHRETWRAAVAGHSAFRFAIRGLGVFPEPRRPRVLWAGIEEERPGALESLAADLESAARRLGFAPETRPFRPHLTLARAARDERPRAPGSFATGEIGRVVASEVVLFRSELLPAGARYTPLASFPLAREDGGSCGS